MKSEVIEIKIKLNLNLLKLISFTPARTANLDEARFINRKEKFVQVFICKNLKLLFCNNMGFPVYKLLIVQIKNS
jgi:hypothetical protein